jgi:hypothetical protein
MGWGVKKNLPYSRFSVTPDLIRGRFHFPQSRVNPGMTISAG